MATELWHPDIEITEALAKRCIEEQFPKLASIETIKFIGEGWDNKVFLINETIVFRFPRRKVAVELIERENKILQGLQGTVNLDIPHPQYIGQPNQHYAYPFHGYNMLNGVSGCHAHLTSRERIDSIIPLAHFLKKLHCVNEEQALSMGSGSQIFDRTETNKAIMALNDRVDKIMDRKICSINKKCFQHEMKLATKIKAPLDDKVLVHGDLYCRHLMFDQGKLTGIIDWGDSGVNNRAVDLSVIFSFYPSSCHQDFLNIYGAVETHTWQLARFLGLYCMLTVIPYGHDVGDEQLVREAISGVKRINAELLK